MSDKSDSNDDKSRNRSVVYVYSPEYIQICDSLMIQESSVANHICAYLAHCCARDLKFNKK